MTVIAVTGSAGLLGRHVVSAMQRAGHDVRGVDMPPSNRQPSDIPFVSADLNDLGAAVQALAEAEVVIHTAAIPRPVGRTASDVFRVNVLAAHNVTEAALIHGARRILNASSFSVIGWPFNPQPFAPAFLPIDESHALTPQESYGLSKLVTEEIMAAAARRSPALSVINLRMPWIQTAATFAADVAPRRGDPGVATGNLWAYIDADDAAAAFVAALDADVDGHASVYIAAPDTFMEEETLALVNRSFPGVELRGELDGHASVISSNAAERLLGVGPTRSWRSYAASASAA
jgi:nucleoside-diphosphate-sugar epimerase